MKLFILKLLSLVVICLGLLSLFYAIGVSEVTDYVNLIPEKLEVLKADLPPSVAFLEGMLSVSVLWLIGSTLAIVLGIYGLFPQFSKWRKGKKISYQGPHGQVQIQLDTVERRLNEVLSRMPEVKKIHVTVEPKDGGRSALIKASTILQQQPGENARSIAGLVSDYIAETATKMLGLEELATIELNVTGINLNTRKSSKAIRKESLSHSGNAPVELLEASPKPRALSAPGEPLGSGPIEEEMEEEDATGDTALEASAVDSKEEDSRQAAARSELLEPLNLNQQSDYSEDHQGTEEEPEDDAEEESIPSIEEHSVSGDTANVSVVPEPLGDLGDESDELEEEADDDVAESAYGDSDAEDSFAGTELPVGMAEEAETDDEVVDEYADDASVGVEVPEDDMPVATPSDLIEDYAASDEVTTPAPVDLNSPWAPLDSDNATHDDTHGSEDLATTSNDLPEEDLAASTDSIIGDLDGDEDIETDTSSAFEEESAEAESEEVTAADEGSENESANEDGDGTEKKKWGWFN